MEKIRGRLFFDIFFLLTTFLLSFFLSFFRLLRLSSFSVLKCNDCPFCFLFLPFFRSFFFVSNSFYDQGKRRQFFCSYHSVVQQQKNERGRRTKNHSELSSSIAFSFVVRHKRRSLPQSGKRREEKNKKRKVMTFFQFRLV